MLMPFDLRRYLSLFGRSFRDNPQPKRFLRILVLAIGFPLVNLFGNLGMALDYVFFPAFRRAKIVTPVFIIGHARSGTTLMHTLLSRDRERFTAWLTWELTMPSITQKQLVRWVMALDREYLGGWLERKITEIEDQAFAEGRRMHPMGLRVPEEDAFLMIPTFMQCQLGFWFPYPEVVTHLYYMDEHTSDRDRRNRQKLMRFYRAAIQRQIYLTGGDTVFLSKSPVFTGSIKTLGEAFPDARFIVMMRNPYQTIPSLLKLMSRNFRAMGFEKAEVAQQIELLAEQCLHYYRYPLEALADFPTDRAIFVSYTDLIESPSRSVAATCAQLGFEVSPPYDEILREEEKRSKQHRAEHVYSLEEFGLTREEIRAALPEAFGRFGWQEPVSTE